MGNSAQIRDQWFFNRYEEFRDGQMFVAIKDKRDGHDFVQQAKDSGAVGALVSRWVQMLIFHN